MATETLTKWGNSQGVIIPKSVCEEAHVHLGDKLAISTDGSCITIAPVRPAYRRAGQISIEDIFAGWDATYEAPSDWPTTGNEIDWGEPAGAEVW